MAFAKYFIFLRILRHHKVIALALGAPGVGAGGRPAGPGDPGAGSGAGAPDAPGSPGPAGRPGADRGPRDARTVRHYKVIALKILIVPSL